MDGRATRRRLGVASSPSKARRRAEGSQPHVPETTNAELLAGVRRGDRRSWALLLDRYERLIYAIPRRCGLSAEDAADVFQDVLHAFLKGMDRIRDPEALPAWFLNTAFRTSVRRLKAARRLVHPAVPSFWDHLPDPGPDPAQALSRIEAVAAVYDAVARLRPPCRRFLSALFLEDPGASYKEVAERLRTPIGSLGPTRKRCLGQLLEVLQKRGISGTPRSTYGVEGRRRSGGKERGGLATRSKA